MKQAQRRAVFLDRDGTIIADCNYPRDPAMVRLLPGAAAALARLRDAGFALVLVSNQSGIARGMVTAGQAAQVHLRLIDLLAKEGVCLDGAYYCPHGPEDGCDCRKPAPGMLLRAAAFLDIDPAQSFLVGDKQSDIEAGRRVGCRTVFLTQQRAWVANDGPAPDCVAADWRSALNFIVGGVQTGS
jgi:histidinol-phosphate phosphatase family protein